MAAFVKFYGISPSEYWDLRLDELAAMRELMHEYARKGD